MATRATIGSLVVNILGNVSPLDKSLKSGQRSLNRFQKDADRTAKAIGFLKASVIGLIGADVLGRLTSEFLESASALDSLAKTSDKLGIASDQLSALRFAGEQTGVTIQTMDMALQRMERRISEAASGTGEAKKAIEELGLSAQALTRIPMEQQFRAIAAAMSAVEKQSDRLRLSQKLFDSEGVALVNTLNLGTAGLEEMERQARELGIAFDRDVLRRVESFNDALNRLSNLVGGFKQQVVIDVAPAAQRIVESLERLYMTGNDTANQIKEALRFQPEGEPQMSFFGKVADELRRFGENVAIMQGWRSPESRTPRIRGEDTATKRAVEEIPEALKRVDETTAELPKFNKMVADQLGRLGKIDDKILGISNRFNQIRSRIERELILPRLLLPPDQRLFGQPQESPLDQSLQTDRFITAINRPLIAGTVEAFREVNSLDSASQTIAKKQLSEQEQQTDLLDRIERKIAGLGGGGAVLEETGL